MNHLRCVALAIFGALCLSVEAFADATAQRPPVEAFGSLPAIADVKLSPDGKYMAAVQSYKGRPAVAIYQVGAPAGTIPAILIDEMHYIVGISWATNERLLVTVYEAARANQDAAKIMPWVRAFSVDTKAQNPVMLLKNSAWTGDNYASATVADVNLDDPEHPNQIIMPLWVGHPSNEIGAGAIFMKTTFTRDLYRVDVTTGKAEPMLQGDSNSQGNQSTTYWIMDGHGHAIGRIDQSPEPLVDHLKLLQNGDWREVASYDAEADHGADVAGLTSDGKAFVRFALDDKTKTDGLVSYDIATGKTTPLFFNPTYDVDGILKSDWDSRVIGAAFTDDTTHIHYFDPAMQALQKGLEAAFPGNDVIVISTDRTLDKVVAKVSSTSNPPTFYFLDRKTHFAGKIGEAYPKLHAADLGEVKPYPYTARDGLHIPGYLTLPPGKPPKNLPVVVMPHGGPEARDSMRFDWWAQFLANRGYAVLQPNFRGSAGYGHKFREEGFHQWGLKMQDDITDGVNKLVADGIADPKRICIVGASYGGYAALAGAAFTPGLYACAVSYAGVSDLPELLKTARDQSGPHSKTMSYLNSRIGDESDDLERLKATSPALHANQIKCPVLLLHGEGDWTVRIDQSKEMYDKLKAAGKSVQFIRFQGEDHYLERADTRIEVLTEIEKFLAANIGN